MNGYEPGKPRSPVFSGDSICDYETGLQCKATSPISLDALRDNLPRYVGQAARHGRKRASCLDPLVRQCFDT